MIIKIYPQNPNEKSVAQAADILARDGVIIYPTDRLRVRLLAEKHQGHRADPRDHR